MICPTSLTRAYPFGGKLDAKFFRVLPDLHPLCLTYLTYIYIYYKGSRGVVRPVLGCVLTSLLARMLGNVGQSFKIIGKYCDQPALFGWAMPNRMGSEVAA